MQQLGKKEIKSLAEQLKRFNIHISKKDNIAVEDNFYYVDKEIRFFEFNDQVFPTLKTIYNEHKICDAFKTVTVDMGAIKFVINGADIMRPGIPKWDEGITKNEPILVIDESHGKPISLGISLFSSQDYHKNETGKAVKNIHYVGDSIWHSNENE